MMPWQIGLCIAANMKSSKFENGETTTTHSCDVTKSRTTALQKPELCTRLILFRGKFVVQQTSRRKAIFCRARRQTRCAGACSCTDVQRNNNVSQHRLNRSARITIRESLSQTCVAVEFCHDSAIRLATRCCNLHSSLVILD